MKNAVEKALDNLPYKIKWQERPRIGSIDPVISFHFFNQNALFGDGTRILDQGSLQVDVFSKADYSQAVEDIRKELEKAKFRFSEMWDDVEEINATEKIYHKIMIFNYLEREVKNE